MNILALFFLLPYLCQSRFAAITNCLSGSRHSRFLPLGWAWLQPLLPESAPDAVLAKMAEGRSYVTRQAHGRPPALHSHSHAPTFHAMAERGGKRERSSNRAAPALERVTELLRLLAGLREVLGEREMAGSGLPQDQ